MAEQFHLKQCKKITFFMSNVVIFYNNLFLWIQIGDSFTSGTYYCVKIHDLYNVSSVSCLVNIHGGVLHGLQVVYFGKRLMR